MQRTVEIGAIAMAREAKSGTVISLGTGTTVKSAVEKLGELYKGGTLVDIKCVCTSEETEKLARSLNLPIVEVDDLLKTKSEIDLAIDGADEVDPDGNLIKGRGAALFREKFIEKLAKRFVIVADVKKQVPYLGVGSIPLEVVNFGIETTKSRIEEMLVTVFEVPREAINVELRMCKDDPTQVKFTDNGNVLLDLYILEPEARNKIHQGKLWSAIDAALHQLIGIVETGFFIDFKPQIVLGVSD